MDFQHDLIADEHHAPAAPQRKESNPHDDFEHIPSLGSAPTSQLVQEADLLGNFNQDHFHKAATIDFMASERQTAPAAPAKIIDDNVSSLPAAPAAPLKSSIYDDIENESLQVQHQEPELAHDVPEDKFNSSEDLLGGYSDDEKEDIASAQTIASHEAPHSGVEDIPIEKPVALARNTVEPVVVEKPVEPVVDPVVVKPVVVEKPAVEPVIEAPIVLEVTPVPVVKPVVAEVAAVVAPPKEVSIPSKPKDAPPQPPKKEIVILADDLFCKIGLDAWFNPDRLHPKVEGLIYWRDVKKSGIVFGAGIVFLLAVSIFSVISVFAYSSLLALTAAVSFRIYKTVLQAVQKTSDGHPFQEYLEIDLSVPQEKVQELASVGVAHFNALLAELRRLFLVEDLIDSIKFGALLWGLTYLGSWFNGMTLVILAFVALFTFPKIYENNKQEIDAQLNLVRSKVQDITEKIKAAIPIGKKPAVAAESEKDK